MKTTMSWSRRSILISTLALSAFGFSACASEPEATELGEGGLTQGFTLAKKNAVSTELVFTVPAGSKGTKIRASVTPAASVTKSKKVQIRLWATNAPEQIFYSDISKAPSVETSLNSANQEWRAVVVNKTSGSFSGTLDLDVPSVEPAGGLKFHSYNVRFTNPDCGPYDFGSSVETVDGGTRSQTVENAYCNPQTDSGPSGARPSSPLYNLKQWINGDDAAGIRQTGPGDEIVAGYFSFSNKSVKTALCDAAKRGARVTFIKDANQDATQANELAACNPDTVRIIGHGNQNDIGYHHNKFLIVNPAAGPADFVDPDGTRYMKIVFSSGNMSSGTVLHQENWHFIEPARDSYFAQSHVCLVNTLLNREASATRKAFTSAMAACRENIAAEPETDIEAFFIPSRTDSAALRNRIETLLSTARIADVAVHRFSLFYLQAGLRSHVESDPNFRVRLVADDDLYWLYPYGLPAAEAQQAKQELGDNMAFEATNIYKLRLASNFDLDRFEARFVETNSDAHLLHHNKFIIGRYNSNGQYDPRDAVVTGAANFTNDAFWAGSDSSKNNFENIYYIRIPHVVQAMERQYDGFWGSTETTNPPPPVATSVGNMPRRYVHP